MVGNIIKIFYSLYFVIDLLHGLLRRISPVMLIVCTCAPPNEVLINVGRVGDFNLIFKFYYTKYFSNTFKRKSNTTFNFKHFGRRGLGLWGGGLTQQNSWLDLIWYIFFPCVYGKQGVHYILMMKFQDISWSIPGQNQEIPGHDQYWRPLNPMVNKPKEKSYIHYIFKTPEH